MELSRELIKAFSALNKSEPESKDTSCYGTAVVRGDNIFVVIDGSTIETPASTTMDVQTGDRVIVEIKNHSAVISGNTTVPTDRAKPIAQAAMSLAEQAVGDAARAQSAADSAEASAESAQSSADSAAQSAATANTNANQAIQDAARAQSAADSAQTSASQALTDAATAKTAADNAQSSANAAQASANAAQSSANTANRAANGALNQASVIEDVLDTVTWIAEHGEFTRTTDTTIDPDKVYFIKVGNNYEAVAEPVASDLNTYYNLIIDESMQNYISSHLALTNAGLWVTKDGNAYKILVSNTGIVIYDELGHEVSSFGEDIIFSSDRPQRIGGEDAYIEYYDSDNDGVPDSLRIVGANISMGDGTDLEDAVESAQSQIDLMITPSGSSSFVLTQTMIQAMTNQFVIKGSDNTTTVISGGKISANSIKTGDLATDAIKSNNYSYTSGKYSNNGTYLNLANGEFISKNFGIDSNGNAYFKGELTATKLTIAPGATFEGDTSQFKGDKGDPGESVASVTNYYLATSASSGVTRSTSGWTTAIQTMTATNQYLWNYEVVNGSKGTILNTTDPVIIGRYGQNGGKGDTGRGITSIKEHYQVSSSNTTPPASWSDSMVNTTTTNKYLWNYETITYTDGTTEDSTKRVIGTHGATGARGATWYAGTAITGTSTTPTIFSGSGITSAIVGDHYLNTSTQNVYRCTVAGAASVAKWVYEQNIKGTQGTKGDKGYLHIKYSNDGGSTFTGNSGEDPGSYIGTYSDNTEADSTSVSAYTWVKIEGDKVTASKSGTVTTIKINGTEAAKVNDGTNGLNNATVTLYRRGTSAPAKPNGNVTYTFATGAVSGSLNSWTKEIPSGTDPVWAIVATASSTGTTDTIGSGEWSDAVKVITNGTNGNPGYNQATIFLYQRATSAPSKPSAAVTYTFSSGALSSVPSGWSRTVPAANGNPCFVTTAVAIGTGTTASIAASAWSDVVKLVEDGKDGKSLTGIVEYYARNNSTTAPEDSAFGTSVLTPTASEKYVWNYEQLSWNDNGTTSTTKTTKHIVAVYGDKGNTGKALTKIEEYYAINNSTTAPADSSFSTTVKAPTASNKYLWNYELLTWNDNGTTSTTKTDKHIAAVYGDTGADSGNILLDTYALNINKVNAKYSRYFSDASNTSTVCSFVSAGDEVLPDPNAKYFVRIKNTELNKYRALCFYGSANYENAVGMVVGDTYKVSCWVRQLEGSSSFCINLGGVGGKDYTDTTFVPSTEWQKYEKVFTFTDHNKATSTVWSRLYFYNRAGSEINGAGTGIGQIDMCGFKLERINAIATSGRNLCLRTSDYNGWDLTGGTTKSGNILTFPTITASSGRWALCNNNLPYSIVRNQKITISYKVKGETGKMIGQQFSLCLSDSATGHSYTKFINKHHIGIANGEWQSVALSVYINDYLFASGSGSPNYDTCYFNIQIGAPNVSATYAGFQMKEIMVALGSDPCAWSPAPEDSIAYTDESIDSLEIGGRNLVKGTSDEWHSYTITDGTNKTAYLFGLVSSGTTVLEPLYVSDIQDAKVGDKIQVSFDIKFSSDWKATGTGTKRSYVQGNKNHTGSSWASMNFDTSGWGGQKQSEIETVMASSSKEGRVNTWFLITQDMINGTYSGQIMTNIRFDYYSGTVSIRRIMVEKGDKATTWAPAPEDTTQYFWFDEEGAHISTVMGNPSSGYNSLLTSQALLFRLNQLILMQLTGTDIRFYQNGNEKAIFGSNVELKNGNMLMQLTAQALKFLIGSTVDNEIVYDERVSFGSEVAMKSARTFISTGMEDGYYSQNFMDIKPDGIQLKQIVDGSVEEDVNGTFISNITGQGIKPNNTRFILGDGVYGESGTHLWYTGDNLENGILTNADDDGEGMLFIAGWVTGSGKELMFTIPLCAPIAKGWDVDKGEYFENSNLSLVVTVRQNNHYLLGSGSAGVEIPRNATEWEDIDIVPCPSGISVHYYSTTAFSGATNNDACGIKVGYNIPLIEEPDSSNEEMM